MYKVSIRDKKFEVNSTEDGFMIDNTVFQWNLVKISDGYFHIIYKNKSYAAEIVKADFVAKTFHLKINGTVYPVSVQDKFDILLEKMGMNNAGSGKVNSVKAPMPGLIIDLKVAAGDTVKAGEPLLILEAMKMENIIKSPGDGVVKKVNVKKGQSVEKNQVLIEF